MKAPESKETFEKAQIRVIGVDGKAEQPIDVKVLGYGVNSVTKAPQLKYAMIGGAWGNHAYTADWQEYEGQQGWVAEIMD